MRLPALVVLSLSLLSTQAGAVLRQWPTGPAPCNNIASLQACVNAAGSGDIIELAANAIPAQSVTIPASGLGTKSLALRPAAGFVPRFASFSSITAVGGDVDVTISIEGITLERGVIQAIQGGEGTFDVTFRRNKILATSTFNTALQIRSGNTQPPYGPTHFLVENNEIDISVAATDTVSAIAVGGFQGGINVGSIVGNVIRQFGGGQSAAIDLANGSPTLQVDVIGNRISGSNFNSGVGLFQFAPGGSLSARVINNLISGQVDTAGAPAGISLNVSQGSADFRVINNTVAFNQRGLLLGGRPDLGATVSALIANNIFAFNEQQGISISDFGPTVVNEANLVFGNGSNFFAPGPGTVFQDPLFVSPANLALKTGSAARDAGFNARIPPDITTDVFGSPRIRDGVVEIGAIEDGDDYLLLSVPCGGSSEYLPTAFADLGLTALQTHNTADFEVALTGGKSWDLVLIDMYDGTLSANAKAALQTYVAGGGRAYMNSWSQDAQTAASFGANLATSSSAPLPLRRWIPSHPLVSDPEAVGDSATSANLCGTDSWTFEPKPGALAVAGFTATPTANQAALVVGNGGRSMLLGITPGLYPSADMLPLLRNAIRFLLTPDILLLDSQCGGSESHFPQALQDLDLGFHRTLGGRSFDAWLASGIAWRLAIVDGYAEAPFDRAALQAYVQRGGRAWWSSSDTDSATASEFEGVLGAPFTSPQVVRRWFGACCGPHHPVYEAFGAANVQTPSQDTCGRDGFELGLSGGGVALAGSTAVPTSGHATLVAGNHGRTLLFGAMPGLYKGVEILPLLRGGLRFLLDGYPVYTTESFGSVLRSIHPDSGRTYAGVGISLGGSSIDGAPGLAQNPLSGELWAVASVGSSRSLVRIDPRTGNTTSVGSPGVQLAALAFDCRGTLYGVSGDGDPTAPESLFKLSTLNGSSQLLGALGHGDNGEALAFGPADGLLRHGSGRTDKVLETVAPSTLALAPVPLSGAPFDEFRGLTWAEPDRLLLTDGSDLFSIDAAGVVAAIGPVDHSAKGLANTDVRCCTNPDDADCDGRPNVQDLCPFYQELSPSADADHNGRGDECSCGDQTGDGRVDVRDIVAINVAIFNPPLISPLCDTNGDGLCNVSDIVGANIEIFSPGSTSICGRQPAPGP